MATNFLTSRVSTGFSRIAVLCIVRDDCIFAQLLLFLCNLALHHCITASLVCILRFYGLPHAADVDLMYLLLKAHRFTSLSYKLLTLLFLVR